MQMKNPLPYYSWWVEIRRAVIFILSVIGCIVILIIILTFASSALDNGHLGMMRQPESAYLYHKIDMHDFNDPNYAISSGRII